MATITRRLIVDSKGTLAPFTFVECKVNDRSVFVKENLLVDGKIPEAELKALATFLTTDEVEDDLSFFSGATIIVRSLYTNPEHYSTQRPKEDFWIK